VVSVLGTRAARVVLVDDHPTMRMGVRRVLESASWIDVVGEAGSGRQALSVLERTDPDVVFLDLGLPDGDGLSLVGAIRGACSKVKIVVFTCLGDEATVRATFGAGVDGFLTKIASPGEIVDAVRRVCCGQVAASADVVTHLASRVRQIGDRTASTLTAREREVWREVAKGSSNREIAQVLFVSEHTVKFHVHNLLRKLGLKSRAEAAYVAHQQGIATS
jgi:two-component system nitrate/nitrite response regulator NarL